MCASGVPLCAPRLLAHAGRCRPVASARFRSTRAAVVAHSWGAPSLRWGCGMPGGGSDASVAAARRQPLSGDGEGTSEPRHQLRAGAGDDLAKVDEQIDAMLTALTRVTLHLTSLRPLGDAEDSAPTEREKMILVAMKQMDWKLEQLRKDRDKLAGAQSDHVSRRDQDGRALGDALFV